MAGMALNFASLFILMAIPLVSLSLIACAKLKKKNDRKVCPISLRFRKPEITVATTDGTASQAQATGHTDTQINQGTVGGGYGIA